MKKIEITIIGGGMIVYDQILPSIYHLQRLGLVDSIKVVATSTARLKALVDNEFKKNFPNQSFKAYPDLSEPPEKKFENLYLQALDEMSENNLVIIALPDQLHHKIVKKVLEHNQNVICVKPLCLKYEEAKEIEEIAYEKGLFVGIEYHKRFDRRTLIAKKHYKAGHYGEFIIGEAKLIEPYYYRHSNFQNWFTTKNTDPFVYIGCHYVDMVTFITGLKPTEVSVRGIKRKFPNGNEGYLWSVGSVVYENGAIFTVTNGLGYPDKAGGSNQQGIEMFFEGNNKTGYLKHNDQFRGIEYSFLEEIGPGCSNFNYVNPDYFKMVPWEGNGYKPVGYGYDSIEANIKAVSKIVNNTLSLDGLQALGNRQVILRDIDRKGLIATPANSSYNELVIEAARESIQNNGKYIKIKLVED